MHIGDEWNFGFFFGFPVARGNILPGNARRGKLAGAGHQLLQSGIQLVGARPHRNSAIGDIFHFFFADFFLDVIITGEYFLRGIAIFLEALGQFVPVAANFRFPVGIQGAFDIGSQETRNHQRTAHADQFRIRSAQRQRLEHQVFAGNPAAERHVDDFGSGIGQYSRVFMGFGMQQDRGNPPTFHHVPRAHAGTAAGAIHRQQVQLGVAGELDSHGEGLHAIGTGLQRDPLEADFAQIGDIVHEIFPNLIRRRHLGITHPAVAGERANRSVFEGFLHFRDGRIRVDKIAAFGEPNGIVQIGDLDLPANAFGALAPFELNDHLVAVFVDNILGHAVAGIFDIHLNQNRAISVIVTQITVDSAIEFRRFDDFAVFQNRRLIDADHILADNDGHAQQGGADRKGFPIFRGDKR